MNKTPAHIVITALACLVLGIIVYRSTGADKKTPPNTPKDPSPVTETPAPPAEPDHVPRKPVPPPDVIAALPPDGGPEFNRLIFEKSPYLLQHAGNPVDWHPWGEDAFAKARRENKPIFLSIGYSTCHWCHVMERESFEMRSVGKIINKYFVPIKVDREERPDVDRVYMTYIQATSGGGGWPMSVWLTPELTPFFAGTYFPPEDQYGRPGFKSILVRLAQAWDEKEDMIEETGREAIAQLQRMADAKDDPNLELQGSILSDGYEHIISTFDPTYGGFGREPKFPRPVEPAFVLRYSIHNDKAEGVNAVLHTLRKMADGGIHDHVGKGFARYAVDNRWHVPHFEKMLYDQGQLVPLYLEAFQVTRDPFFADIARDILAYVQRDMTGEFGQFYSAEDADSPLPDNPEEQAEGAFYVWEYDEIIAALGEDDATVFNYHFGVEKNGNVKSDPHGEFPNKNVLIIENNIAQTAQKFERPEAEVRALITSSLDTLYTIRERRPRPHLDDKTITAWNGLMISAFARSAAVLGDASHLASARKAAAFIRDRLYNENDHTLRRRFRAGEAAIEGYADDYAYLIRALLDLYETTFETDYLVWAKHLQTTQDRLFWDGEEGGYYSTSGGDASILLRMKETYDGAEPSPNSVAAMNLLRLGQLTGDASFREKARKTFLQMGRQLRITPSATPAMLSALDVYLGTPKQIVIAGTPGAPDTEAMLSVVRRAYLPDTTIILADGAEGQAYLAKSLEFIKDMKPLEGKATAYICENYACQLPTNDPDAVKIQLTR